MVQKSLLGRAGYFAKSALAGAMLLYSAGCYENNSTSNAVRENPSSKLERQVCSELAQVAPLVPNCSAPKSSDASSVASSAIFGDAEIIFNANKKPEEQIHLKYYPEGGIEVVEKGKSHIGGFVQGFWASDLMTIGQYEAFLGVKSTLSRKESDEKLSKISYMDLMRLGKQMTFKLGKQGHWVDLPSPEQAYFLSQKKSTPNCKMIFLMAQNREGQRVTSRMSEKEIREKMGYYPCGPSACIQFVNPNSPENSLGKNDFEATEKSDREMDMVDRTFENESLGVILVINNKASVLFPSLDVKNSFTKGMISTLAEMPSDSWERSPGFFTEIHSLVEAMQKDPKNRWANYLEETPFRDKNVYEVVPTTNVLGKFYPQLDLSKLHK